MPLHHVYVVLRCVTLQVGSMDAADLAWSPNGSSVAVQDSMLTYKVFIIGPDGSNIGSYRWA